MFKAILAPVTGLNIDVASLENAYFAAQVFNSHIHCLYVRPDPKQMFSQTVVASSGLHGTAPNVWAAVEEQDKVRAKRARAMFDEFCARRIVAENDVPGTSASITAAWQETTGDVADEIVHQAQIREMIVLSRGAEPAVSHDQIGDILVRCGRPLVLVPPTAMKSFGTTIAIAWKETAEAARAMTGAMPFLAKAKKVVVLSADEGGDSVSSTIESAERLIQTLRWNGISADLRRLLPETLSVPHRLLSAASNEGADLLVMGAYSHSRAQELIFGGTTRYVLSHANLPVLFCH